jgi:hypothetical protein
MTVSADEIELLQNRIKALEDALAIQFGMHPGGDLAKASMAKIERLRAALENAEQFLDLFVNGTASIQDGQHTLSHVRVALENGDKL